MCSIKPSGPRPLWRSASRQKAEHLVVQGALVLAAGPMPVGPETYKKVSRSVSSIANQTFPLEPSASFVVRQID